MPKSAPKERPKRITASTLKERGWTKGAIDRFLGDPDDLAPNPHYRSAGAPMRLYNLDRVEAAEASEEFRAWQEQTSARRQAASARMSEQMENAREEPRAQMRTWDPAIPLIPDDEFARLAVAHRNALADERAAARDDGFEPSSPDDVDDQTLDRWKVNYLRHRATDYDTVLDQLAGRVGRAQATDLVRERVYDAIADAYPLLGLECVRQLDARTPDRWMQMLRAL